MADESHVLELLRRRRSLRNSRGQWDSHWDDLAAVMLPRRVGFVTQTTAGERRTDDIYDGTPMQAARGLANAISGEIRPDGQDWFFIRTVEDEDESSDEAKDWLADTEDRMREAMENAKARFRQATGEADVDLVVFGTAVLFVGEGDENLLFQTLHLKDVMPFFGETGNPEGLFSDRRFTVRQAAAKFTLDKLSESTRIKFEKKEFDEFVDFVHAIVPREEGRAGALFARNLPIADLWIEVEAERLVQSSGFHEFPFVVPRWDTSSGEDYGRSPGMIALPDSNTAQAMGSTLLIAGQRAAAPPLLVPDDGFFDAPNTVPDGLVYYDATLARELGRIPIAPLESGGNIPLTREMQNDNRDQIWNAFFRNILRLPTGGPQMTATEVIERKEEFIREIGPVFGRLETDYTAPIIERVFNIMLRASGAPQDDGVKRGLAPIPDVLLGRGVRFEYQSPIKRIRQQIEAAATRAWVAEQMNLAQIRPDAMDVVNVDGVGRITADAASLPQGVVNGEDEVAALRQQRAEAEQAALEAEQLQAGVETASTAAGIPGVKEALEGAAA